MLKNIEVHSQYESMMGVRVIKSICKVIDRMCSPLVSLDSVEESKEEDSNSSRLRYQTIQIKGLDHMLLVFTKMADLEQAKGKEKEITTLNVQGLFAKLNWRHLLGLEAICIFF